ncbi:MAG: hypothetical protein VX229_07520 [Pseudomonadota bacterium]|nr:hypothetical protein [Pseudomonadota bacterium]
MTHPTDAAIKKAVNHLHTIGAFHPADYYSESPDSVRIAYQWLDAQRTRKTPAQWAYLPLKHVIECWGGRYVSTHDVITAAFLHPRIKGLYPELNLSRRLVCPDTQRLEGIAEAGLHAETYTRYKAEPYALAEQEAAA